MAHGIEFNLIRRKEERAYGSLGDLLTSPRHVRYIPNNGSWAAHPSLHWLSVYEYSPERAPPLRLKDSTSAICFGASPMGARPLERLASGAVRSGEMWIMARRARRQRRSSLRLAGKWCRTPARSWGSEVLCALCLAQRRH